MSVKWVTPEIKKSEVKSMRADKMIVELLGSRFSSSIELLLFFYLTGKNYRETTPHKPILTRSDKRRSMTIPRHEDLWLPILGILKDDQARHSRELEEPLAHRFKLTAEEVAQLYDSGNGQIF